MDVLRNLGLPMPDDVLEQFVFDHGTKHEFQQQYGDVDLHAVRWQLSLLTAGDVIACSVFPSYKSFVTSVADRMRVIATDGWSGVNLPPDPLLHWQQHGTWMRPPIVIRGALLGLASVHHLVEGHTRCGALRGLVELGALDTSSEHQVWIGEGFHPERADERWQNALRTERIPFLAWMMGRIGDGGQIGEIAARLIEVQYGSSTRFRIKDDDALAVLEFARQDPALSKQVEAAALAHEQWMRFVGS
jgi:hypothetical protein